ncbi:Galactosyltransferase family protein [Actinidia rufa]|uniref:Hexosyltransferase n=1 Tax=Actinidia rufa TaxID=165716 RepID=A0A7J0E3K6_9ERIC|nr:Galactosyltransferase family protein [Actinidia rufa]
MAGVRPLKTPPAWRSDQGDDSRILVEMESLEMGILSTLPRPRARRRQYFNSDQLMSILMVALASSVETAWRGSMDSFYLGQEGSEIKFGVLNAEMGDRCLAMFSLPWGEVVKHESKDIFGEVSKTHNAIQTLDKTIWTLEMELAAARAAQESILSGFSLSEDLKKTHLSGKRRYFMVVGINTAFSSRKRRDSVRATWMPQREKRKKLEEEKGSIIRFVIGHSATVGGIQDRAIEAEDKKHGDFLRLDHVEGYLELSAKTKTYFATATATAQWDADFYVKVDDDVHVNIATLGETLARYRKKPRVYIGCMKSGPVLAQKGARYHEPEYWKFGETGNMYFRHATGQLYAISKDLATYISINQHVLHKYANKDVSLGSWFIGLDVQHIDDRRTMLWNSTR